MITSIIAHYGKHKQTAGPGLTSANLKHMSFIDFTEAFCESEGCRTTFLVCSLQQLCFLIICSAHYKEKPHFDNKLVAYQMT